MNRTFTRIGKAILSHLGYQYLRVKRGGILYPERENWLLWQRGMYRAIFRKHLQTLLSWRNIDLVIDVGANIGQYGSELRELGYSGDIISFEPVQELYSHLRIRAETDPRWDTHCLALGSKNTIIEINKTRNPLLNSVLVPGRDYDDIVGVGSDIIGREMVEMRRLDDLCKELIESRAYANIMLKMDTQGYNDMVFAGAKALIEKIVVLQSELSAGDLYVHAASMLEELALYKNNGFMISCISPLTYKKHSKNIIEYDCLMTKENI